MIAAASRLQYARPMRPTLAPTAVLLLVACSDTSVTKTNALPEAQITAPTATSPQPPPADAIPSDTARLRAVKVSVPGATSTAVQCGDRSGVGASSAIAREVPPGRCTVRAVVDGRSVEGDLSVDSPRGWTCVVGTGGLTCS